MPPGSVQVGGESGRRGAARRANVRITRDVRAAVGVEIGSSAAQDVIGTLGLDTLTFLVATVIVIPFFRSFKASPILGFLLSGVALNQLGLIRNISDVKALSELGILFLLFEMGLELSIERLRALAKFAFGMGLPQVLLTTLAFAAFELPPDHAIGTRMLEWAASARPDLVNIRSVDEAIVIGAALSLSSSAFVLQLLSEKGELATRLLSEKGELATRVGSATLGILLLQDIAVVPLLVILPILESGVSASSQPSDAAFEMVVVSGPSDAAFEMRCQVIAGHSGGASVGHPPYSRERVTPCMCFETSQNTPSFTSDIAATPCMCFETSQNTPSFTSDIAVTPCMCFETSQNTPSFTSDIAATPCMCFETSQNTPSFTSDIAVTPCMCFETSQNTPSFTSDIAATPCMCFETSQNTPSFTSDIAVTPCMCFETSQNTPSFTSDIAATPCMCFETSQNTPSFTSDIAVTPCMCFEMSQNTPSFTSDIAVTPCMCFETSQNTPSFTSDIAVTPCMCFETSQNTPSFSSDIAATPCMCFETSQNTPSFTSDIADFTEDSLFPLLAAAGLKSPLGLGLLLYFAWHYLSHPPTPSPLPPFLLPHRILPTAGSLFPLLAAAEGLRIPRMTDSTDDSLFPLLAAAGLRSLLGLEDFTDDSLFPLLAAAGLKSLLGDFTDDSLFPLLAAAGLKSLLGLGVLLYMGRLFLRRFFEFVAESRSTEAFVALCLLTVTGTSLITSKLGFSDSLGAFLAGALLAETNYRTQVEADIRPFRGLLLGLFFVTTGTSIDLSLLAAEWPNILLLLSGLIAIKTAIITPLSPFFLPHTSFTKALSSGVAQHIAPPRRPHCHQDRHHHGSRPAGRPLPPGVHPHGLAAVPGRRVRLRRLCPRQPSIRTGLLLSQGGEFAFVVFALASQ
ncbi:unnamed protein product [Closterium sp. NIES-64]|nr:unnamed protein product [Closterium sp. NIES-64]